MVHTDGEWSLQRILFHGSPATSSTWLCASSALAGGLAPQIAVHCLASCISIPAAHIAYGWGMKPKWLLRGNISIKAIDDKEIDMGTRTESTFRIGLDDTDHPDGGCTTFDLNSLTDLLVSEVPSFREIERRLVRLWPYAERRTWGMPHYALWLLSAMRRGSTLSGTEEWVPEPSAGRKSSARPAIVGEGTPRQHGTRRRQVPCRPG